MEDLAPLFQRWPVATTKSPLGCTGKRHGHGCKYVHSCVTILIRHKHQRHVNRCAGAMIMHDQGMIWWWSCNYQISTSSPHQNCRWIFMKMRFCTGFCVLSVMSVQLRSLRPGHTDMPNMVCPLTHSSVWPVTCCISQAAEAWPGSESPFASKLQSPYRPSQGQTSWQTMGRWGRADAYIPVGATRTQSHWIRWSAQDAPLLTLLPSCPCRPPPLSAWVRAAWKQGRACASEKKGCCR